MPWANSVPAIVHAWYLGNATGDAIADVLFGKVNPSGKLPITFPARLEDVPSFGHFNVDDGKVLLRPSSVSCEHSMLTLVVQVRYAEDIFVVSILLKLGPHLSLLLTASQGYKHYQHRRINPAFAFGCVKFQALFNIWVFIV
jgi:beta-glucosidase